MVYLYPMVGKHSRQTQRPLAFIVRLCCALALCAVYLSSSGDWRAQAAFFPERGLRDDAGQRTPHALCYVFHPGKSDTLLPGEREKDPFQAFLSLRALTVPGTRRFFSWDLFGFSGTESWCARISAPDVQPIHLGMIAQSRQLLC